MLKTIKKYFIDKDLERKITEQIIESWEKYPENWILTEHEAVFGDLRIWITNSPYADMKVNSRRLPCRPLLRIKLNELKLKKAILKLNNHEPNTPKN